MVREKTLIKCDKCESTSVFDEDASEIKINVLSMDEYIKKNQSRSIVDFSSFTGVSHMEKRVLICDDCGYKRIYDRVVYT